MHRVPGRELLRRALQRTDLAVIAQVSPARAAGHRQSRTATLHKREKLWLHNQPSTGRAQGPTIAFEDIDLDPDAVERHACA
jgi:hypothetical protein